MHAGPKTLNNAVSFGYDRVPNFIHAKFADFLVRHMHTICIEGLKQEDLFPHWLLALLNPIPNTLGVFNIDELRPLVLQNTAHKWFAAIIALQLEDFFFAISPVEQKAAARGVTFSIICKVSLPIGRPIMCNCCRQLMHWLFTMCNCHLIFKTSFLYLDF